MRMILCLAFFCLPALSARAQETEDVGKTGFDVKRPVLAAACPHGCPWGELGDFIKEAMEPLGYEVILCRNCNRAEGPRIVAKASRPPELTAADSFTGTTTRVDAPVDFGITESGLLAWAHSGLYTYKDDGPYSNLRLIAKIEDPTYLLVAVKADSGITDLSQIADQHMAVKILGGGSPISQPVLDYYGLTEDAVMSWGGSFQDPIVAGALYGAKADFDLIVNELASPANNPESTIWSALSQNYELRFLDLPTKLLDQLADDKTLGLTRVTAQWGLLRGVDRALPTVARSGHAIFARDDAPDDAAYDVAKAIDAHRDALKWYIRPYSYESRSVAQNLDVPLHPGAERYYREQHYLTAAPSTSNAEADAGNKPEAQNCGDAGAHSALKGGGGCSAGGTAPMAGTSLLGTWLWLLSLCTWRLTRRDRRRTAV